MKKFLNIILVFIGVAGLFSCDDYLDRPPIADLDPSNYFRSESEIRSATLNAYTYLDGLRRLQHDHFTDNCFGKKNTDAISYTHGDHTPSLSIFKITWEESYKGISQANLVINGEMGSDVPTDVVNSYKGDAYFMRAYYYADLLFHFGSVPVLTGTPSVDDDIFPSQKSQEEVKQQILNDLAEALKYLPRDPEKGRAGIGAAQMLKARVHAFVKEYTAAKDAAKAVIDLQKYSLFSDFRSLFYNENEDTNGEVIFSIQYQAGLRPNEFYQKVTNSTRYSVSISLADEFEMGNGMAIEEDGSGYDAQAPYLNCDPRFNISILTPGDTRIIDGVETPMLGRAPSSKTGMIGDKYQKWGENYEFYNGSDFILMRYADALLLYAETLNEVESSPSADVYNAINEVRSRVQLPGLPEGLSKDEMRDRIRKERRVELAFEGQRLFDIFRWEIGEEAWQPLVGYDPKKLNDLDDLQFQLKTIDSGRSFNLSKGYFWPIPQTEIDLNENLVQNPGFN